MYILRATVVQTIDSKFCVVHKHTSDSKARYLQGAIRIYLHSLIGYLTMGPWVCVPNKLPTATVA
jgi:hypothetical protein